MADIELIKPRELPEQANVQATDALMVDNGTVVGKATPEKIVNAGAPVASEAEALAGVNNNKRMTPLRVRQVLDNVNNPAVLRAQAWAESSTPPDPLLPDSKSAKTWASIAEQGTVMVQWSMIAADGQTVLGNDITTGEPIRAFGGVAQISVNGFGPITPEEYSVDSDGVVTLTAPLAEGDVVSGFTQPRLSNSEAQAVVQGVLQQTGDDVAAAQAAAAQAEFWAENVGIVLTSAFGSLGTTLDTLTYSTPGVVDGATIRVGNSNDLLEVLSASSPDSMITGSGGVKYRLLPQNGSINASILYKGDIGAAINTCVSEINRRLLLSNDGIFSVAIDASKGPYSQTSRASLKTWTPIVVVGGLCKINSIVSGVSWSVDGMSPPSNLPDMVAARGGSALGARDGTLIIEGPGLSVVGSIGLLIGNPSATAGRRGAVRCGFENMVFTGFETNYQFLPYDTYLVSLRSQTVLSSMIAIRGGNSLTGVNSGERYLFNDSTFVARNWGLEQTTPGQNFDFVSCSFDFCRWGAIHLASTGGFSRHTFQGGWIEGSNDIGLVVSEMATGATSTVMMSGVKLVPTTTKHDEAIANGWLIPANSRPDGISCNRTLYIGKFRLVLNGIEVPFERHNHGASQNLFLCDDDVELVSPNGIVFTGWKQIPSRRSISNSNWDFSSAPASGGALVGNSPDLLVARAGSSRFTWSTSMIFGTGSSAKLEASGADVSFRLSTPVSKVVGTSAFAYPIVNYAEFSGTTGSITTSLNFYDNSWKQPTQQVTVTMDGAGFATLTFPVPHGYVAFDAIKINGATNAMWQNVNSVPSATTVIVRVDLAFPIGSTAVVEHFSPAQTRAFDNILVSVNPSSQYGDTDYFGYNGNRDWWLRSQAAPYVSVMPSGAAYMNVDVQIPVANGNTVYLGALPLAQW